MTQINEIEKKLKYWGYTKKSRLRFTPTIRKNIKNRALELKSDGKTVKEIAKILEVSEENISKILVN
jgi:hypothetical protein